MGWADEPINEYGTIRRQCTDKAHFPSRTLARRIARSLRRQYKYPIDVYQCRICGRWHLSRRKIR
jgi:hypothetical protein